MYEDREFAATFSIEGEGGEKILKGDAMKSLSPPLIDLSASCMSKVIEQLKETGPVTKIVLSQKENYVYDDEQAALLAELAILVQNIRQTSLGLSRFSQPEYARVMPGAVNFIEEVIGRQLTEDPIGAYVAIVREIRTWEIKIKDFLEYEGQIGEYIGLLKFLKERLDGLELIKRATPKLIGYNIGSRELYQQFFRPQIEPNFVYSRIVTNYPAKAVELDSYKVFDSEVIIFSVDGDVRPYYHIVPPEFDLDEEKYELLETAKQVISEHRPTKEEFVDPEKTRRIFTSIGRDLLLELAASKGIELNPEEKEKLAEILVRYTIGFGILEVLLDDPKVQDITINAPAPINPVYIVHADFGECKTNITLTAREVENWASKLRIISGRPLDEANPVLDTSLDLTRSRARIAAIDRPLSPDGLAFSVRRHRNKPWTLPLFIGNKMITPLAAGVLSFLIDGSRTFLIAGTRSSGKTSMLSAIMTEIMRTSRIVVVEDTLELAIAEFRKLGYDIQNMKVQAAITKIEAELSASQGIRTSLRLGDSSLIVGEVRSEEAVALYEAMRVGALANVVAGTIHGDSPYGVFDRVVNDLGVPRTSFKATDIIVVANPVKTASGLEKVRRVTQITEVRKFWEKDPLAEQGFGNLLLYNPKKDILEPTDILLQGESEVIKQIAGNIRELAGNWDRVWENIQLRADAKEEIIKLAQKSKRPELLEAEFVILANDMLHKIMDRVTKEVGYADKNYVFKEYSDWLRNNIRRVI